MQQEILIGNSCFYGDLQVRAMPGVHEGALAAVLKYCDKQQRILEIGSGAGSFTRRLHENGFQVTASGIDPTAYKYDDVEFEYLDILEPLDPRMIDKYDVVIATEVIEHIENIFLFLRNVRQVLSAGGTMILTTPNVLSLFSKLMFLKTGRVAFCNEDLMESWGHIQILPQWHLRKSAEEAGLIWVESRGIGSERFDLAPKWHKWLNSLVPLFRVLMRERFPGELQGSNLLMVCKKENVRFA